MAKTKRKSPSTAQQRAQAQSKNAQPAVSVATSERAQAQSKDAQATASVAASERKQAQSKNAQSTAAAAAASERVQDGPSTKLSAAQQREREREKLREKSARTSSRRRYTRQRTWYQNPLFIVISVLVVVAVVVGIFFAVSSNQTSTKAVVSSSTDQTVLKEVTSVSAQVASDVGTGGVSNIVTATTGGKSILKDSSGKPVVFYYGAEYCPYCAAQRWSMVVALSRFGTFTALPEMASTSTDVDPNTPTFTFLGSKYTSSYIDFSPLEAEDRSGNTLQSPNASEQTIIQEYSVTGFPFIDFADQFTVSSPMYDASILQGLSQKQVASQLSDSNSNITKNIVGAANYMTAAICIATDNMPASACSANPIPAIEQTLVTGTSYAPASGLPASNVADMPSALALTRPD